MKPRHVLIAGGGVAGLETLLALHALAGDRVDVTLLAPDPGFVNRSMALDHPATPARGAGPQAARHHVRPRCTVAPRSPERVEHDRRVVVTERGRQLRYDRLVLALGAQTEREWRSDGVLTYRAADSAYEYRLLLRSLERRRVTRVAFVKPAGPSWTLPLYELALATAEACEHGRAESGDSGGRAARDLRSTRQCIHASGAGGSRGPPVHGQPRRPQAARGGCTSRPAIAVCSSTVSSLCRGSPDRSCGASSCDPAGFIRTDRYGRVVGMPDVFAAGDATAFPIKQGGHRRPAGGHRRRRDRGVSWRGRRSAAVPTRPPRTRNRRRMAHYIRARIAVGAGDDCEVSERPLWWPPNRLCGRYLAPYLSSRVGGSAVMFQDDRARRLRGE